MQYIHFHIELFVVSFVCRKQTNLPTVCRARVDVQAQKLSPHFLLEEETHLLLNTINYSNINRFREDG